MAAKKANDQERKIFAGKPVNDEAILRVAKEVIVKFIEVGRLSPQNFSDTFKEVYSAVESTVRSENGEEADKKNSEQTS